MERRRVLVIDDNQDAANALAAVLELNGYGAYVEFDGAAAFAAAAERRPDAVLLDLGLPGLSGYDVCRRLRTELWGRETLIIALTGWGREEDRANAREAGFNYFILKPVEFETLDTLLRGSDRRSSVCAPRPA